jgi:hypothetical protein
MTMTIKCRSPLTDKINKLTIALAPPKLTPGDLQNLEASYRTAQDPN